MEPSEKMWPSLAVVANWSRDQNYNTEAINEFLGAADYYLIVYARTWRHTIVTSEKRSPGKTTKIKIPDVCDNFGIPCLTPFEMLRQAGVRFSLDSGGDK